MSDILELQRSVAEDCERLEQAVADRLARRPAQSKREAVLREHEIAHLAAQHRQQSQLLQRLLKDEEGERKQQVDAIHTAENALNLFYAKSKAVRDFYRRYPDREVVDLASSYARRVGTEHVLNMFTGEERFGRYFDLNALHDEYCNLKDVERVPITVFVDHLGQFDRLPRRVKTEAYSRFVDHLLEYLETFCRKTRPLEDHERRREFVEAEFAAAWSSDGVPGWQGIAALAAGADAAASSPDVLYCPACDKLFSKDTVYKAHLTGKKHTKAVEARSQHGAGAAGGMERYRQLARKEFMITQLLKLMEKERRDTRENLTRKQTLTNTEWEAEIEALEEAERKADAEAEAQDQADQAAVEDAGMDASRYALPDGMEGVGPGGDEDDREENDGEEKLYNPLKLPLGWDGKPIPFWLWKLHGLGVEYPCEICGNFVYMGRRNFDRHFFEQRHTYGLKCLGISNSYLFNQVCGINDAIALNDKLRRDKKLAERRAESTVEVEDSMGNVMSERVYNDLKAQGLL